MRRGVGCERKPYADSKVSEGGGGRGTPKDTPAVLCLSYGLAVVILLWGGPRARAHGSVSQGPL